MSSPRTNKQEAVPSSPGPSSPGPSSSLAPGPSPSQASASPTRENPPPTTTPGGLSTSGFQSAAHWSSTPIVPPPGDFASTDGNRHNQDDDDDDDGNGDAGRNSDVDSSYGNDDDTDSTASLTSSILEYRHINGRRFHSDRGDVNYWGANDKYANEALDIHHHLMLRCHQDRLVLAPIPDNIERVLDVGTGTGLWAMDFGDQYPMAQVIGTDISPTQPTWVPPNVRFEMEDFNKPWTFQDNSFDYVHMRYLVGSVKEWEHLMSEAYRVCKPGGWIETGEETSNISCDDGTMGEKSALAEWGKIFVAFGELVGHPMDVVPKGTQRRCLTDVGCVDIGHETVQIPLNPWPADPVKRELGRWALATYSQDLEGFVTLPAARVLQWTAKDVSWYCAHVRNELNDRRIHSYAVSHTVWGRKPLDG